MARLFPRVPLVFCRDVLKLGSCFLLTWALGFYAPPKQTSELGCLGEYENAPRASNVAAGS